MIVRFLWRLFARSIFLALLVCCSVIITEGFVADTLVRTPSGYAHIQDLCVGDELLTYTFEDTFVVSRIIQIAHRQVESTIRVNISDDAIEMAEDQLLFIPLQRTWLPASEIYEGMYLLGSRLNLVRVQSVERVEHSVRVYTISVFSNHNYLVGKHGSVVHNFGEIVTLGTGVAEGGGFLTSFLAANPLVAPVTIAVGGAGLAGYLVWTFISEIKESRKTKRDQSKNNVSASQPEGPKKPNDDCEKKKKEDEEFNKNHPNGRYEDAGYHKSYQSGQKSPRPINGQEALDNSYPISKTTPRRIGVSNKEFVVLDRTRDGLYHGHVRRWAELTIDMQKALTRAGIVNNGGKFII